MSRIGEHPASRQEDDAPALSLNIVEVALAAFTMPLGALAMFGS